MPERIRGPGGFGGDEEEQEDETVGGEEATPEPGAGAPAPTEPEQADEQPEQDGDAPPPQGPQPKPTPGAGQPAPEDEMQEQEEQPAPQPEDAAQEAEQRQTFQPEGAVQDQGVEEFGREPRFREAAQEVEQAFLERRPEFEEEDVAVFFEERDGETRAQLQLTESGAAFALAEQLRERERVPEEAVEMGDGEVFVDLGEVEPTAGQVFSFAGEDMQAPDIDVDVGEGAGPIGTTIERVTGGREQPEFTTGGEQATPRENIIAQFEEQTGVNLGPDDIEFEQVEQNGETVIRGELTRGGLKRIEQETAFAGLPQGTPVEGAAEFAAGVGFEFEEFRREQRERVFDRVPSLEEEFETRVPDLSEEFEERVPRFESPISGGIAGAAAVGVATPEPVTTVSGAALLAGVAAGTITADVLLRPPEERETPTIEASEIDIPESGEQFVQDEAALPSRPGLFTAEMGLPDPQQQTFLGVPEQGVIITPEGAPSPVSTTEIDIPKSVEGVDQFPSEMEVPKEGGTEPFVSTQAQQIQRGRQRERQESDLPDVPEEFISERERRIGSGVGAPFGGKAVFRGRQPREEAELVDPFEKFLAFGEAGGMVEEAQEPQAVVDEGISARPRTLPELGASTAIASAQAARLEAAQDAQIAVDQAERLDVGQAPATGTRGATMPGVDTRLDAGVDNLLDQPLDTGTTTTPTTAAPGEPVAPGFEFPPQFGTPEEPAQFGTPFVPPGGGQDAPDRLPLPDLESKRRDDDRERPGDIDTGLFQNIPDDVDEALEGLDEI